MLAEGERIELELPFDRPTTGSTRSRRSPPRARSGSTPGGRVDVRFSALRGERVLLGTGATVINDCYNANPLSMRAALDDLATHEPTGRRLAVLGDMLELGPDEDELHREIGAYAAAAGVDVLVTVGPARRDDARRLRRREHAVGTARRPPRWPPTWSRPATSCS